MMTSQQATYDCDYVKMLVNEINKSRSIVNANLKILATNSAIIIKNYIVLPNNYHHYNFNDANFN